MIQNDTAYDSEEEKIVAYINGLIQQQRFLQALYYCNNFLLFKPDSPLVDYVLLKRIKIQFITALFQIYGVDVPAQYNTPQLHSSLHYSGISHSLYSFLKSEGFDTTDSSIKKYSAVGYPSLNEANQLAALIQSARMQLDSVTFKYTQKRFIAEKDSMISFLNEFEQEMKRLAVWDFIEQGKWNEALAYSDSMAREYPSLQDEFRNLKQAILDRPTLETKSPPIAGILSAVFPGLGQTYAHNTASGLRWFTAMTLQAAPAVYLLYDIDIDEDRSEVVLGTVFSLTSLLTYISGIRNAVTKTQEYNESIADKEVDLFIQSLESIPIPFPVPPGLKE